MFFCLLTGSRAAVIETVAGALPGPLGSFAAIRAAITAGNPVVVGIKVSDGLPPMVLSSKGRDQSVLVVGFREPDMLQCVHSWGSRNTTPVFWLEYPLVAQALELTGRFKPAMFLQTRAAVLEAAGLGAVAEYALVPAEAEPNASDDSDCPCGDEDPSQCQCSCS